MRRYLVFAGIVVVIAGVLLFALVTDRRADLKKPSGASAPPPAPVGKGAPAVGSNDVIVLGHLRTPAPAGKEAPAVASGALAQIDRIIEAMDWGNLAFNAPRILNLEEL